MDSVQVMLAALKACSRTRNLERGKLLHGEAVKRGYDSQVYVANAIINLYAKCSRMVEAREMFDSMKYPTVVSWNVLILGYAENGEGCTALDMFTKMRNEGPAPDSVTLLAALKACTSYALKGTSQCRDMAKCIHNIALTCSCNSDVYVQNTLIDMFAKCGSMANAREVFDGMKHPDVVAWTALILGYADNGQGHIALDMFSRMKIEGPVPDPVTLVAALKACTSLAVKGASKWVRDKAKEIHDIAVDGRSLDVYVQNTLLDMYAKCGSMIDAHEVFDGIKHPNIVSWNALISGYADNGQGDTALDLLTKMRTEGPSPDSITLVAGLKACTSLIVEAQCRNNTKQIHNFAIQIGCNLDTYFQSALVDSYAKCSSMGDARVVFDSMKNPDVVSWNALIWGYAANGEGQTALDLFTKMRTGGPASDFVTFGAAFRACGLVGALEFGRTIHSELDSGNNLDVVLVSCLVDFYAKCGSLVEAQSVFELHSKTRNVMTWTALLAGFSSCGDNEAVFGLFERMQDAGIQPNGVTFLCILTCCSHSGLVDKGKECFDAMITNYGIVPNVEHYNCMIDLYGRANKLDEAMILLAHMPCSPNNATWMSILSASRKWKHVEIGHLAYQSLIDLNDKNVAAYVLMGQIFGSRGMIQEQGMVMGLRKKLKGHKNPGETFWTNDAGTVHTFLSDGSQHPQIHEIRRKWDSMVVLMRHHGYTPNFLTITPDNTEEETLCGHSERLAIVCALINTEPGKTIRIVKNMRVCDDCHRSIALISKLDCRTVICRDAVRIHAFKDGKCSCGIFVL